MDQHLVFTYMENFSLSQKINPQSIPLGLCCAHFHGPQACFLHQVSCMTKSSKKSFDVSFPHPQVPQLQLSWERTWQEIQWTIRACVLGWVLEMGEICTFEHREMKKKWMKSSSWATWKPELSRHRKQPACSWAGTHREPQVTVGQAQVNYLHPHRGVWETGNSPERLLKHPWYLRAALFLGIFFSNCSFIPRLEEDIPWISSPNQQEAAGCIYHISRACVLQSSQGKKPALTVWQNSTGRRGKEQHETHFPQGH